jgi:hypothetical protein
MAPCEGIMWLGSGGGGSIAGEVDRIGDGGLDRPAGLLPSFVILHMLGVYGKLVVSSARVRPAGSSLPMCALPRGALLVHSKTHD